MAKAAKKKPNKRRPVRGSEPESRLTPLDDDGLSIHDPGAWLVLALAMLAFGAFMVWAYFH